MYTAENMLAFAKFVSYCEHDLYADNNWYYLVYDTKELLTEDQLLPYWERREKGQ